jgi:UDP-N-acetylmuramyl pentapeptide synthase
LHLEVSGFFDDLEVVLLIGESWSRSLQGRVPGNCRIFCEYSGISAALKELVSPGDIVLFKGSRSFGMERVLRSLKEESL